jgi:hypothetical protein
MEKLMFHGPRKRLYETSSFEHYVYNTRQLLNCASTSYEIRYDELWDTVIELSRDRMKLRLEQFRSLLEYPHWSQVDEVQFILLFPFPDVGSRERIHPDFT